MRIELCAGGIGGISVADFQTDMRSFLSEKEAVIASFKAVSSNTGSLSGGVGSLSGALEDIQARIIREETALEDAKAVQTSMNDFLELAQRVDAQVASDVDRNKEDFYGKYPELRPPSSDEEEKAWYEKAWEALCGAGEAIKEAIKDGLEVIADTLKKAWDGLVEFYNEHKKIIDTILIIAGAVLTIIAIIGSGGFALAGMTSLIMAIGGCSAATAATISAVIGVTAIVSTCGAAIMDVIDVWLEIDNPIFNFLQGSFKVISAITTFVYTVGSSISKHITIDGRRTIQFNGKTVVLDESTFDPNLIDPQGRSNIQRMQQGLAPIGPDGKSVNIHHIFQNDKSPVIEMTADYHQKNYGTLHKNTGQYPSKINRTTFNDWRTEFWKWIGGQF